MKGILPVRNLLFLICSLLCGVALHAQTPAPAKSDGLPAPRADTTKVSYDRFEDKTTVSVEIRPARVALPDGSSELVRIPLTAEFECAGQDARCSPALIVVSYAAGYRSLAQCDSLPVVFLADRTRIPSGNCRWLGSAVLFEIRSADFIGLAKATQLQAKIGLWLFNFNDESLDAIRSLAQHLDVKPAAANQSEKH